MAFLSSLLTRVLAPNLERDLINCIKNEIKTMDMKSVECMIAPTPTNAANTTIYAYVAVASSAAGTSARFGPARQFKLQFEKVVFPPPSNVGLFH